MGGKLLNFYGMKKLIAKFNFLVDNSKFEYFVIFIIVFLIFATILKEFSFELTKGNSNLLLSVLGVALAYAVFFISYKESFIDNKEEKRKIQSLIEGLFVSSFFPVIAILMTDSNIKFGVFHKYFIWSSVILMIISLFIFSFCVTELWLFMLKKVIKRIIRSFKSHSSIRKK